MKEKYVTVLAFSLIVICFLFNNYSFHHAKRSCIEKEKTPMAEKTFLDFKWSVSC